MHVGDISVTIKVAAKAHQRLFEAAKARGYRSAAAYAQILFDAGFAARVGQERGEPVTDDELDRQVRLVFACAGQGDTAAIARATGIPEARVERILEGFRTLKREGCQAAEQISGAS